MQPTISRTSWVAVFWQGLILLPTAAVLWWALSAGRGWGFGLVAVVLTTAGVLWLLPPRPLGWRWRRLPGFAGFFLWQSLRGGVDVARRALRWELALEPVLLSYRCRLRGGIALSLFANTISLLPGSLTADLNGRELLIHCLSSSATLEQELRELEEQVARLFGQTLTEDSA